MVVVADITCVSGYDGVVIVNFFYSGGSGRTGTYIAISMLLDRLKVEGVVESFSKLLEPCGCSIAHAC